MYSPELFSHDFRRVAQMWNHEAQRWNDGEIKTEHILYGILRGESHTTAKEILETEGKDHLTKLKAALPMTEKPFDPTHEHRRPLHSEAESIVKATLIKEGHRDQEGLVDSVSVLIALIEDQAGSVGRVLREFGWTTEKVCRVYSDLTNANAGS